MLDLLNRVYGRAYLMSQREEGQTLVEYALIIALVSIGLTLALGNLRDAISGVFGTINSTLSGA